MLWPTVGKAKESLLSKKSKQRRHLPWFCHRAAPRSLANTSGPGPWRLVKAAELTKIESTVSVACLWCLRSSLPTYEVMASISRLMAGASNPCSPPFSFTMVALCGPLSPPAQHVTTRTCDAHPEPSCRLACRNTSAPLFKVFGTQCSSSAHHVTC